MKIRTLTLATGVLAAALVLAGCSTTGDTGMEGMDHGSSSSPADDSSNAEFNDADVNFAMGMAVHHKQAIEMSETLLAKDGIDERVAALAEDIKAAQAPEIQTMNTWLEEWGADTEMGGMDHGGMMSEDDMAALEQATGPEASSLFLEQMIEHHEGAIQMAQGELDTGTNADALDLAQKIVDDQNAEIAEMQQLLDTL
ncbi:DUF305 domain-containing protein [Salinibacterium sp. SYSU T00001]|uniref:DUF305 domain-containing protein n=1 Tax=Homoserinimonas sedimenticola TaxID=2986805 RepID=UPI0022369720|nr:DUF305 domain-containing protein [Salinibacterium sedimenticola]MCW4386544.1 DUF305 domain-containing protein [Salinibacterium sedimenticola]